MAITEELKKVADFYGYENQSNQLIEECAELIQAVNKYRRASGKGQKTSTEFKIAFMNIIEEVADVEVMLEQIKYLLNISEEQIEAIKHYKQIRTETRMSQQMQGE